MEYTVFIKIKQDKIRKKGPLRPKSAVVYADSNCVCRAGIVALVDCISMIIANEVNHNIHVIIVTGESKNIDSNDDFREIVKSSLI